MCIEKEDTQYIARYLGIGSMEYERVRHYNEQLIHLAIIAMGVGGWLIVSMPHIVNADAFQHTAVEQHTYALRDYKELAFLENTSVHTNKLLTDLRNLGGHPVIVSSVTRDFFTGKGTLVTLNKDNFSVFEYTDEATALAEIETFRKSAHTTRQWKRKVHLYTTGNLIVFYMGIQKPVIQALHEAVGDELVLQ